MSIMDGNNQMPGNVIIISFRNSFFPLKHHMQTLILGNREAIDEMSGTSAAVLTQILKLIDKYDLYGQVAYPKHHKQSDVPDIYRLAAKTKVFSTFKLFKNSHDPLNFR